VSEFSDDWLALRAAADSRARADRLVQRLRIERGGCLEVLDLGCGTGANLRHLAPLLGAAGAREQHWTCVDHADPLLARLAPRTADWAAEQGHRFAGHGRGFSIQTNGWVCRVETCAVDLAAGLAALQLPADGLVTASALLDLVSAAWLDDLLARCRGARCQLLFALSYDGRCDLRPTHPEDAGVIALVNRHQRGDKGFGPALGPDAAAHALSRCGALGFDAQGVDSDWQIGPDQPDLQRALIDGWHHAALELAPALAARLDDWRDARAGWIREDRSHIRVGHVDLAAVPAIP
jgi:SAM-dependent methyltransferase